MTLKQFTCDFTGISPHIQCCKSLKEQNKHKIKKKKLAWDQLYLGTKEKRYCWST